MFQLIFGIVVAIIDVTIRMITSIVLTWFTCNNLLKYKQYFFYFVFNISYVKITFYLHINHMGESSKIARDSHVISTLRICPKSLITERALYFTDPSALIFILLT